VNPNSKPRIVLAFLLSLTLFATGCSAQWVSVALADLPVLTQMALNIATVVVTLQSGSGVSAAESAAIQNISNQASKDLNLLETFYNQYQANPNANTLQQIQGVIADINQNLPALLQAANISDPVLSARITAAVNLILTTVNSFAALMPQPAGPTTARKASAQKISVPHAKDLKTQWNQQVCAPTGNASLDAALSACLLK
jgi:hypothetical protein